MLFAQGGIVDAASFVPNPIALSSAESEYNAAAFGITAAQHIRQLFQELHGLLPDTQLSIPLVMDSSSAIAIASKSRDTRHTHHIQRRIHRNPGRGPLNRIDPEDPVDLSHESV